LRWFCVQYYPHYQIVFGCAGRTDTAIPIVDRLMQEFPNRDMMLLIDQTPRGTDPKVANLVKITQDGRLTVPAKAAPRNLDTAQARLA
jgi:hypothetical protein